MHPLFEHRLTLLPYLGLWLVAAAGAPGTPSVVYDVQATPAPLLAFPPPAPRPLIRPPAVAARPCSSRRCDRHSAACPRPTAGWSRPAAASLSRLRAPTPGGMPDKPNPTAAAPGPETAVGPAAALCSGTSRPAASTPRAPTAIAAPAPSIFHRPTASRTAALITAFSSHWSVDHSRGCIVAPAPPRWRRRASMAATDLSLIHISEPTRPY